MILMGVGRAPCCDRVGLNRGAWTPEEDTSLVSYIRKNGHDNWRALPKKAGLLRCGKSCRLRWINYLRPDIRRGNFTKEEEDTVIELHGLLGNKWSKISSYLPGRTDNEIKNVWNTHLKKRSKLVEKSSSSPATSFSVESKCNNRSSCERIVDDEVMSLNKINGASILAENSAVFVASSDGITDTIDEILGIDIDSDLWNDITIYTEEGLVEKQRWLAYLEDELGLFDDDEDKRV